MSYIQHWYMTEHQPHVGRWLVIAGAAASMSDLHRQFGQGNVIQVVDHNSFPMDLIHYVLEDQHRRMEQWKAMGADGDDADVPLLGFYLADAESILKMMKRRAEQAAE